MTSRASILSEPDLSEMESMQLPAQLNLATSKSWLSSVRPNHSLNMDKDGDTELANTAFALLCKLEENEKVVALPVIPHTERIPSGARGVSAAFLRGLRSFFKMRGRLEEFMESVCKEPGSMNTVCAHYHYIYTNSNT